MRKITHAENQARQAQKMKEERLPFHVILNDIRSLHNVGSIFRTCDGVGVAKLWICGITGFPPNNQIAKTALGAEDHVDWEYDENIQSVVSRLRDEGFQIIGLEQTVDSVWHTDCLLKSKVCLIVGNEVEGIDQSVADLCDQCVEIEMSGVKNSLNVSVAFGIAAYHVRSVLKG